MRSALGCAGVVLALAAAPVADAQDSELILSWGAPHGQPGSRSVLAYSCGDTTRADTLYVSVRPAVGSPTFYGFTAQLLFRSAARDSLGPYWKSAAYPEKPAFLRVEFPGGAAGDARPPWSASGVGDFAYDFVQASSRVRMLFAVPANQAKPIEAGVMYTLARVLLTRPPAGLPGCQQPVCVQLDSVEMTLELVGAPVRATVGNHRMVSINSAAGRVCRDYRTPAPVPTPARADSADSTAGE